MTKSGQTGRNSESLGSDLPSLEHQIWSNGGEGESLRSDLRRKVRRSPRLGVLSVESGQNVGESESFVSDSQLSGCTLALLR